MDSKKKNSTPGRVAAGLIAVLLALGLGPMLYGQTFSTGGTAALGDFLNPLQVNDSLSIPCNYDSMTIDLNLGKVFAHPFKNASNTACSWTLIDITAQTFTIPGAIPVGGFVDGVLQVGNFRVRVPTLGGAGLATFCTQVTGCTENFLVTVVPNANNTPVMIISTGTAQIDAGVFFYLGGNGGGARSGFLRGVGGLGGPGGYRGGDGGNGGLSPSAGSAGFGPGGGPGAVAGVCSNTPASGAKYLTTGATMPTGPAVPVGNDLDLALRGGSGGGGGGGCTTLPGGGGGGGGGAILIAANTSITTNGYLSAEGAGGGCCWGADGSGGTIRLVSATIAGTGNVSAQQTGNGTASDVGTVRLEAFTISFNGSGISGNVAATSAPGQIDLPSAAPAFIQFTSVTDSSNGSNAVSVPGGTQQFAGRTGAVASADVSMPNNFGGPATTVIVAFTAGPNTTLNPFPASKTINLVVTPLDPAQGTAKSYSGAITCTTPPSPCTASITGVTLPLGLSGMSAFTVVNLLANQQLARNFPSTMQGEPIESVKIQTSGKDTEYVLISKSGREFPFKPGTPR